MKASRTEFLQAPDIKLCIRHWGDEDAPKLFMMHGWMDIAASFQFVVDAFKRDWHVIAPDVRGFGHSGWAPTYYFPDYLADLEFVLDHYSPDEPVRLLGQSLGGNIASTYSAVRPHRVSQLVCLEAYPFVANPPERAVTRLTEWLDSKKDPVTLRTYKDKEAVIRRLRKTNPRLTYERAYFLADYWTEDNAAGEKEVLADPNHKLLPVLVRLDEILANWTRITAPALLLEGEFSLLGERLGSQELGHAEIRRRASFIPDVKVVFIKGAGHMLQHDQPEEVAAHIEAFLK